MSWLKRGEKNKGKREEITANINDAISTVLGIVPDHIALVAPHTVPKTSSGKLQRAACKTLYVEGRLDKRHTPAWMQIGKLSAQWIIRKSMEVLNKIGKLIYTLYVALIVSVTLLPMWILMHIVSRDGAAKAVRAWAKLLKIAAFIPAKVAGLENLGQLSSVIYAVNHASYIDTIVMLAYVPPRTRFVGKKELLSVPIIRTFMRKLDYLAVDRIDLPKGIEDTKHIEYALKAGNSILIFPEGTFGYASGLRPFRLGAFKIAAETNTPICPIALQGTRSILRDNEKLMRPGRVRVTISAPISPQGCDWQDIVQLRGAVRAEIAKYCGEPSLDFIAAQTVAPKPPHLR